MRRKMWGETAATEADDDMGHTILGDVIGTTPPQSSGLGVLGTLALGALGASVPIAGIGGYLLSQYVSKPDTPITQPIDDNSVEIGLGRIEDYVTP